MSSRELYLLMSNVMSNACRMDVEWMSNDVECSFRSQIINSCLLDSENTITMSDLDVIYFGPPRQSGDAQLQN